ncbi:hypothetical protein B0T22DRAFT_279472 [Podospora appendiculata]|uniref:C3H1-type domain-containing protein n=1 Tax=Podospora appendiculata TaxID=314037 RepID=A0AAE0X0M2_9PEZI|nr:hypothetical protein B0T22DRAFT_279472 [Podospora appendiculata]
MNGHGSQPYGTSSSTASLSHTYVNELNSHNYGVPDQDPAIIYRAPLMAFHKHQEERHAIEDNLIDSYSSLVIAYREKYAECAREKRNAAMWQQQHGILEKDLEHSHRALENTKMELQSIRSSTDSDPFAFVIIDGDGAVFHEDLIARGEEGGAEAAHQLQKEIKDFLHQNGLDTDLIFVQVVLNLEGLNKALLSTNTVKSSDPNILAKFGRGFGRAQSLFSFVDVGFGKEQADNKVRKIYEAMERNSHCKCIIFGGCHDNGYAAFLEPFRSKKTCLLETTPTAAEFRKFSFTRLNFDTVFRSEPLLAKPVPPPPGFGLTPFPPPAARVTSPVAESAPKSATPAGNEPAVVAIRSHKKEDSDSSSPSNTYAAVGKLGTTAQTIDISKTKKTSPSRPYLLLNSKNQRVDIPLPKADYNAAKSLEEKKMKNGTNFCNKYHLTSTCTQEHCKYTHGPRLVGAELLALKHKTRGLQCSSGLQCRDVYCTLGHHCQTPANCSYGDQDCRLSNNHAELDIIPTLRVYDDGTRELIQ